MVLLFLCLTAPRLHAQTVVIPIPWRVETTRAQSIDHTLYRGETIELQPRFESNATPVDLPGDALIRLLYRSADLDPGQYHELSGSLLDNGRVTVTWTPAADSGAPLYDYNLIVQSPDGLQTLARAFGKLHMRGTVFGEASSPQIIQGDFYSNTQIDALLENYVSYDPTTSILLAPDAQTLAEANALTRAQGGNLFPYWFQVLATPEWTFGIETGEPTIETIDDAIVSNQLVDGRQTTWTVNLISVINPGDLSPTLATSDPTVAVQGEGLTLDYVGAGEFTLTVQLGTWTESLDLANYDNGQQQKHTVTGGAPGTLRAHIHGFFDAAIAADDGNLVHNLFTTSDHSTTTFVRNANAWAYALAPEATWTGLPVSNSRRKAGQITWIRGALISPDIMAVSRHNAPGIGEEFYFLGTDNEIHTATITHRRNTLTLDATIVRFSEPLPAAVQPVKLLPHSFIRIQRHPNTFLLNYLSNYFSYPAQTQENNTDLQLPAVHITREHQAHFAAFQGFWGSSATSNLNPFGLYRHFNNAPAYQPYESSPTDGDSGQPALTVIGEQLVLLSTWMTSGEGPTFIFGDPGLWDAITHVGGIHPSAPIDLSDWPNYSAPGTPGQ